MSVDCQMPVHICEYMWLGSVLTFSVDVCYLSVCQVAVCQMNACQVAVCQINACQVAVCLL